MEIQEKTKVLPDLVAATFAAADLTLTAKVLWSRKPERDEQKKFLGITIDIKILAHFTSWSTSVKLKIMKSVASLFPLHTSVCGAHTIPLQK